MLYLLKAKADINAAPGLFGGFLNLVGPFKESYRGYTGIFRVWGLGLTAFGFKGLGFRA